MAKAKSIRGIRHNTPLLVAAEHMIGTRLSEMLAYESNVTNPEAVCELHEMRIAAKRLRYTVEIFLDAYNAYSKVGPQIKAALREIEQIQEQLGAIHDADVLVPQLNQHLAHLLKAGYGTDRWGEPIAGVHDVDYDACQGLITVCLQLRTERERTYDRFLGRWQQLQETEFFARLRNDLHEAARQPSHDDSPETGKAASEASSQEPLSQENQVGIDAAEPADRNSADQEERSAPATPERSPVKHAAGARGAGTKRRSVAPGRAPRQKGRA
jgi:hypothetical protein